MSENFKNKYKIRSKDFTRNCLLPFSIVFAVILNLIRKSLQVELNSLVNILPLRYISKQAFSAARKKLSPLAFVAINNSLISEYYTDNEFKTWKGYRLIGVDGTTFQLPDNKDIREKYGVCKNQIRSRPMARGSYAYDLLNGITLDAILESYSSSERDLAVEHVKNINVQSVKEVKDLYIEDRGYPATALMFFYDNQEKDFVMRCSSKFLHAVTEVVQQGYRDKVITISAKKLTSEQKTVLRDYVPNMDFDTTIRVRVIVITLNTGEIEILITTLIDKEKFPYEDFANLYHCRWGIEENYKFHKAGLEIENFSGTSVLAIEQDFYASIYIGNVHALLVTEAQEELMQEAKWVNAKYEYRINKKVALGVLKDELINNLMNPKCDFKAFCERVKIKIKKSMVPIREGRQSKRKFKKGKEKYFMNQRRCL